MVIAESISLSLSTIASSNPTFKASSARHALPWVMISIALSAPIKRGRRTVPPNPGMMPSLVSGKPMLVVASPIRKSVASTHSQPPPSVWPFNADKVGKGKSSNLLKMRLANCNHSSNSASGLANSPRNSVISAPTIKASLSELSRRPLTLESAASASNALSRDSSVCKSSLLTEAGAQKESSAIPLASCFTCRVLAW
ncbi:Uncharacterised protein [Vibrio cholerae]|nr:Uncharacterised protein [Vibrio cholerae]